MGLSKMSQDNHKNNVHETPSNVQNATIPNIYTWSNEIDKGTAYKHYIDNLKDAPVIARTQYRNFDTDTSLRESYSRSDYNYFRPHEAVPSKYHDIISKCMEAYKNVSIVKSVMDLMVEFILQGIRISHPTIRGEKLYKAWWNRIKGRIVSQKYISLYYRSANIPVYKTFGRISKDSQESLLKLNKQGNKNIPIPLDYYFLNPTSIDILNYEVATMTKPQYGVKIPDNLVTILKQNNISSMLTEGSDLSNDLVAIKKITSTSPKQESVYKLSDENFTMYFANKDDWDLYAYPLITPILGDLIYLEKMKLADISALDGACQIRLWQLGDLEHKIFPGGEAFNKLRDILLSNTGGGIFDVMWGPDLKLEMPSNELYKFLGSEKYTFVMSTIYECFGLPYSGTSGGKVINNLKVFTQRLCGGRESLNEFWAPEIKQVQKAFGLSKPAIIEYDYAILDDESTEKALWIQLADRDIAPIELVQRRFGINNELAKSRIKRNYKGYKNIPKAGPFHDSQPEHTLKKIALQTGVASPSEVGLPLEEKTDKGRLEMQTELQMKLEKEKAKITPTDKSSKPMKKSLAPNKTGVPGRPFNSKDKTKRTVIQKNVSLNKASTIQDSIYNEVTKAYLQYKNKSNRRKLTANESDELNNLCFEYLAAQHPEEPFDILNKNGAFTGVFEHYDNLKRTTNKHNLSIDEIKHLQLEAYMKFWNEQSNE